MSLFSSLVTKEATEKLSTLVNKVLCFYFGYTENIHNTEAGRQGTASASTWLEQRQARVLTRATGTL